MHKRLTMTVIAASLVACGGGGGEGDTVAQLQSMAIEDSSSLGIPVFSTEPMGMQAGVYAHANERKHYRYDGQKWEITTVYRGTTASMNAASGNRLMKEGDLVANTDDSKLYRYTGTEWVAVAPASRTVLTSDTQPSVPVALCDTLGPYMKVCDPRWPYPLSAGPLPDNATNDQIDGWNANCNTVGCLLMRCPYNGQIMSTRQGSYCSSLAPPTPTAAAFQQKSYPWLSFDRLLA